MLLRKLEFEGWKFGNYMLNFRYAGRQKCSLIRFVGQIANILRLGQRCPLRQQMSHGSAATIMRLAEMNFPPYLDLTTVKKLGIQKKISYKAAKVFTRGCAHVELYT